MRELLSALAARADDYSYLLYCRRPLVHAELDERFVWKALPGPDPVWALRAAAAANRDCDVFLSPSSYVIVSFLRVPCAMVVHDLIPFAPGIPSLRRAWTIERLSLRAAVARADALLCVSESTRRDLLARYPAAAANSTVVPLAAGAVFGAPPSDTDVQRVRERHHLPASYVLSVGTLEPRKNLQRLVDAHAGLPERQRAEHPLIIVGPPGWDYEPLLQSVADTTDVRLLGMVGDHDLAVLYASCTLFCYPSLYEGFGLPVLEALQSGAPTITSNVSSLPEVAGDAALYIDPRSVEDIRRALLDLFGSPNRRDELAQLGRARAAEFSWSRTAELTVAALEAVATDQMATPPR
jgi:glycosyltransferase involved in cell wall biosynthesis